MSAKMQLAIEVVVEKAQQAGAELAAIGKATSDIAREFRECSPHTWG